MVYFALVFLVVAWVLAVVGLVLAIVFFVRGRVEERRGGRPVKKEIEPRVQLFIAGITLGALVMGVGIYVFESGGMDTTPVQHSERGVSAQAVEIGKIVCEPYDGLMEVYPSYAVLCISGHRFADWHEVEDALHLVTWVKSTTTFGTDLVDDSIQ